MHKRQQIIIWLQRHQTGPAISQIWDSSAITHVHKRSSARVLGSFPTPSPGGSREEEGKERSEAAAGEEQCLQTLLLISSWGSPRKIFTCLLVTNSPTSVHSQALCGNLINTGISAAQLNTSKSSIGSFQMSFFEAETPYLHQKVKVSCFQKAYLY